MDRYVFVSSFYKIFEDDSYGEAILDRLAVLAKHLTIHLVCSEKDKECISKIPNVIPHFKEFEDFEMFKLLNSTKRLPEHRSVEKDTKEYMILMNMKSECINLVKSELQKESGKQKENVKHFLWLDAGITKIFADPDKTLNEFVEKLKTVDLLQDRIIIPGCWIPQTNLLLLERSICWRFCGGFVVIPSDLVELFYFHNLEACKIIKGFCDKTLWEVNVWAFMEPKLPIEWRKGNHDESILSI